MSNLSEAQIAKTASRVFDEVILWVPTWLQYEARASVAALESDADLEAARDGQRESVDSLIVHLLHLPDNSARSAFLELQSPFLVGLMLDRVLLLPQLLCVLPPRSSDLFPQEVLLGWAIGLFGAWRRQTVEPPERAGPDQTSGG